MRHQLGRGRGQEVCFAESPSYGMFMSSCESGAGRLAYHNPRRFRPLHSSSHAPGSIRSITRAMSAVPLFYHRFAIPKRSGGTSPHPLPEAGRGPQAAVARKRRRPSGSCGGGCPCILAGLVAFRLHGSSSRPEARLAFGGAYPSWPQSREVRQCAFVRSR